MQSTGPGPPLILQTTVSESFSDSQTAADPKTDARVHVGSPLFTIQARHHAITYCPAKVYCFGLNLRTIRPIVGWKLHRSAELAWLNKHRSTIATWLIISTGIWMKIALCECRIQIYTSEHQSSFPELAAYNSLAPYASHSSLFVKPFNQLKSFIRNTKLWTAFCNMVPLNNSLSELLAANDLSL